MSEGTGTSTIIPREQVVAALASLGSIPPAWWTGERADAVDAFAPDPPKRPDISGAPAVEHPELQNR